MNLGVPFEDWDLNTDLKHSLDFRLIPFGKHAKTVFDCDPQSDAPKLSIETTPIWVTLSSAGGFKFYLKKEVYQRFVDVGQFLNNFVHFDYLPKTLEKGGEIKLERMDPSILCSLCQYLQWNFKYGSKRDRPDYITTPRLFFRTWEEAKYLASKEGTLARSSSKKSLARSLSKKSLSKKTMSKVSSLTSSSSSASIGRTASENPPTEYTISSS